MGTSTMKCVIPAAGYATRLYPLTENFPKPFVAGAAYLYETGSLFVPSVEGHHRGAK